MKHFLKIAGLAILLFSCAQSVESAEAAKTEATQKTILANEARAINSCKALVSAQDIYKRTDWNNDGILEYALAAKGDSSLCETKAGKKDISLLEDKLADAVEGAGKATPLHGYCFKILTKQGANAPGGAKDYIKDGRLVNGYAFVAYPAEYGVTGTQCIMISNDESSLFYLKDLGQKTTEIVNKLIEFNPDKTWTVKN